MKLWEYSGKLVRIFLTSGKVFQGKAYDYTSDLDNEPYGACISIGDYEILESEILKIELLC